MKLLTWLVQPVNLFIGIVAVSVYVNQDVLWGGAQDGQDEREALAAAAAMPDTAAAPVAGGHLLVAEQAAMEGVAVAPAVPADEAAPMADDGAVAAREPLEVWKAARSAAWDGETESAMQLYRELIRLQPENPDAYGELGNVYVQQGDWDSAVGVYYRAAELLADSGESMMAWRLQRIMRGLDRERAEALQNRLMQR